MNRLYLLGALALTQVTAYTNQAVGDILIPAATLTLNSVTYTSTGDCFTGGTATTLGMNNIYYQYYSFSINAGTTTYDSFGYDPTPATLNRAVNAIGGCTHEHLYNWMAQPVIGASAVTDGISDALVAYGYVMSGSTLAACALTVSAVTTTLYSSTTKIFTGARFQHVDGILSAGSLTIASTTISPIAISMLTHYGNGALQTAAVTVSDLNSATPIAGIATTTASNFYYDFAQQQVVQGQTQFGRGGGASTAPCGWWVFYAHEGGIDADGGADVSSTLNVAPSWKAVTVNMWTDNAIMNTIGAFTIATLAALY